ncbi:hypothetical protein [Treponema pedis]|uniref:Uncharacterized protein n=1 Tax=Treponema pedis TaxID=409322 RepID=A0A7S7AXD0_9SPIR|nr:hypothetical protein [Treponema pedis]QOW61669.1 hypothetical protein IFE08_04645 [Treponema pedis]
MKKINRSFFIFIAFIFLQINCSFKPPVISEFSIKRLLVETENENFAERLSVFSLYTDEDGKNDYNSVTVIHTESGLSWVLNRNNSSFFISADNTENAGQKKLYAGSNKIAPPSGGFPEGTYSLIAEDLSGNRDIKTFSLNKTEEKRALPFSFNITENSWTVQTHENTELFEFSLILLGADKQPIFAKKLDLSAEMNGNLLQLKEEYGDARYIQCMLEFANNNFAYLTKPYKLY